MSGPLDPEHVRRHAPDLTPEGARFLLETCLLRKVNLDADTILLLREIGRRNSPNWEPRRPEDILRANLESRGIALPKPREETPAPAEGVVEEREVELDDEGEERPL